MELDLSAFEEGLRYYWCEIERRSAEIQSRERTFPELAARFAARNPPYFTRAELMQIIEWKYTDRRWCNRALLGLRRVQDDRLRELTSSIGTVHLPAVAAAVLRGAIRGVGIAGISAILAAARPDLFPVIDVFALTAICHYYDPPWTRAVPRDSKGRLQADERSYLPYVDFCRERSAELSVAATEPWSPRRVDMALWGIGKRLVDTREARAYCIDGKA